MKGWAISPVVGAGTSDSPVRAQVGDRESQAGDRLEFVIGGRDRCLAGFDVANPANLSAHGGIVLAETADLDLAVSRVPAQKRQQLQALALEHGVDGTGRVREVLRRIGKLSNPNFHEAQHLGSSVAPPTGSFVNDTITDPDNTTMLAHVGETGATWAKHPTSVANLLITANRARSDSGNTASVVLYTASGSPATAEYDVEGTAYRAGNAGAGAEYIGPAGRVHATDHTLYTAIRSDAGSVQLLKQVAGVQTVLAVYTLASTIGETVGPILLSLRDAAKKVYLNGSEIISSTDNVITAAGKAGIFGFRGNATTGMHLDYLTATDAGAPAANVIPSSFMAAA